MHKGKTKFMTNFETQDTITIENQLQQKVETYRYLGQNLKMANNTEQEILTRIKAGWRCFGMHKDLLIDKNNPM